MKGGNNWYFLILVFLAGCLTCYICTQFQFLKINNEVKIIDTLISLATIVVGLYLGITINSKFSNKEHLINFIGPKLEETWTKTTEINVLLTNSTQIDNGTVSKKIKEVNASIAKLNNIFDTFKYDKICINNLDDAIDALEKKLYSAPINNNIIDYKTINTDIVTLLNKMEVRVVEAINFLYNN